MKNLMFSALIAGIFVAGPALAAPGNAEKGLEIYMKRCVWCHGEEGDGDSAAAERLMPPPRDFTSGMYKIKTTGREDMVPNDEDLFRMIKYGMPGNFEAGKQKMNPGGTAMPGWGDILSDEDIWNLVATVKEALSNALRHSGADSIEVRVGCGASQAVMTVSDNGIGFDPSGPGKGLGLSNMASRVAAIGGSFRVDTTEDDGTVVRATFPLSED